ncbi:MAG: replication-relaxation family protein, partial [Acidimicrobiales bacterium]
LERSTSMEVLSYDTEPKCWRRYFGPGGARSVLKPDSLAVVGIDDYEDRYFIEADCGTEHRPHIVTKAKSYVRYWQSGSEQAQTGIFPYVLWIAPDEQRATFLVDVLASLPPEHWQIFMVTTADSAAQQMTKGTTTQITNTKEVT